MSYGYVTSRSVLPSCYSFLSASLLKMAALLIVFNIKIFFECILDLY